MAECNIRLTLTRGVKITSGMDPRLNQAGPTLISLPEVYRADDVFCTGTMGEIAPVVQVDGRTIGSGAPGPMGNHLGELFAGLTSREGEQIV